MASDTAIKEINERAEVEEMLTESLQEEEGVSEEPSDELLLEAMIPEQDEVEGEETTELDESTENNDS